MEPNLDDLRHHATGPPPVVPPLDHLGSPLWTVHAMGRLETKVDMLIDENRKANSRLREVDDRLQKVETSRTYVLGFVAAATIFVNLAWVAFKDKFMGVFG